MSNQPPNLLVLGDNQTYIHAGDLYRRLLMFEEHCRLAAEHVKDENGEPNKGWRGALFGVESVRRELAEWCNRPEWAPTDAAQATCSQVFHTGPQGKS